MPTQRFIRALSALDAVTERDPVSDAVGRALAETIAKVRSLNDDARSEILHLAARFHYPVSPGRDRERQFAALCAEGYTKREARRFTTLVDTQRGLSGDPDKRLLADAACSILLDGKIVDLKIWQCREGIERLWNHLSDEIKVTALARPPAYLSTERYHQPFSPVVSRILGDAVPSWWGYGFPEVFIPVLGHAVDIAIRADGMESLDELDRCLERWLAPDPTVTAAIVAGLLGYKDRVATAGADHITADTVWDHLDLTYGLVQSINGVLSITFGEQCTWDPVHGVNIALDAEGRVLSVGEVKPTIDGFRYHWRSVSEAGWQQITIRPQDTRSGRVLHARVPHGIAVGEGLVVKIIRACIRRFEYQPDSQSGDWELLDAGALIDLSDDILPGHAPIRPLSTNTLIPAKLPFRLESSPTFFTVRYEEDNVLTVESDVVFPPHEGISRVAMHFGGGWCRIAPSFDDNLEREDFDHSALEGERIPRDQYEEYFRRCKERWLNTGICPDPSVYVVTNSAWIASLRPFLQARPLTHYLLKGHDVDVQVISGEFSFELLGRAPSDQGMPWSSEQE